MLLGDLQQCTASLRLSHSFNYCCNYKQRKLYAWKLKPISSCRFLTEEDWQATRAHWRVNFLFVLDLHMYIISHPPCCLPSQLTPPSPLTTSWRWQRGWKTIGMTYIASLVCHSLRCGRSKGSTRVITISVMEILSIMESSDQACFSNSYFLGF